MSQDFIDGYGAHKGYSTPRLLAKHVRRFDRAFWEPAACTPDMEVLDVGCGTGHFLAYLHAKGVRAFLGVDADAALAEVVPSEVAANFRAADIGVFLDGGAEGRRFDRVVLFDVLEHFTHQAGAQLLRRLAAVLAPGGRIVVKAPNMASPWGAQYQFGDLTHRAAYTPTSLRQLALAAGYRCGACWGEVSGSPVRRVLDGALHAVLRRVLMEPPEIFSANFLALLEKDEP